MCNVLLRETDSLCKFVDGFKLFTFVETVVTGRDIHATMQKYSGYLRTRVQNILGCPALAQVKDRNKVIVFKK